MRTQTPQKNSTPFDTFRVVRQKVMHCKLAHKVAVFGQKRIGGDIVGLLEHGKHTTSVSQIHPADCVVGVFNRFG